MSVYNTNRRHDPFKDIDAEELARLRKFKCEARGPHCVELGTQRHHGLVRCDNRRGKPFAKLLDVLINYQCVCYVCHTETGYADSTENHDKFLELQRERYGADVDTFFEMLEAAGKVL